MLVSAAGRKDREAKVVRKIQAEPSQFIRVDVSDDETDLGWYDALVGWQVEKPGEFPGQQRPRFRLGIVIGTYRTWIVLPHPGVVEPCDNATEPLESPRALEYEP